MHVARRGTISGRSAARVSDRGLSCSLVSKKLAFFVVSSQTASHTTPTSLGGGRGVSSVGRAPASHAGSREFDSCTLHFYCPGRDSFCWGRGGGEGGAPQPHFFCERFLGIPQGEHCHPGAQAIDPENAPLPSGLLPYCYRSQPQHAGAPHDSARRSLLYDTGL